MNNCESDSVLLWRVLKQSNNNLLEQYSLLYNRLNELLSMIEMCCEDKNDLLEEIIRQLDTLIQNLIDCCEAIKDRLDFIIDLLIDPIPISLVNYGIVWKDHICYYEDDDAYPETWEVEYDEHICEQVEEWPPEDEFWEVEFEEHICEEIEPYDSEEEWSVEYEDHVCYITDEDDLLVGYSLEYSEHVCIQEWECDVDAEIIDITEEDVIIDFDGEWIDFTCVVYEGETKDGELNLDGDGNIVFDGDGDGGTTTTTTSTTIEVGPTTTTTTTIPTYTQCVDCGYYFEE